MNKYWPLCFLILLFACKREKDTTLPSIQITTPSSDFSSYSFGDLIPVHVRATDDEALAQLTIQIQGNSTNQILTTFSSGLSGKEQTVNQSFPFDNIHINSDTYLIKATAEDESGNTRSAFREIQLFEAPLELLTVGTIGQVGATISIDTLGNGAFNQASNFMGDLSACAMGSYHQELLLGEGDNATIQLISPVDWLPANSYSEGASIAMDHVRDLYFDASTLSYYCTMIDSKILVLSENTLLRSIINLPNGYEAEQVTTSNGVVVCTAKQTGTNNRSLMTFNQGTGTFLNSINLPEQAIELLPFGSDLLVCSAQSVLVFNPSNMDLENFNWLVSNEPISAISEGFAGYYSVAHADGVYFYKFGENLIVFPGEQLIAKELHFNSLNNLTYALTNEEVALINGTTGAVVSRFPLASQADHLFLRFNK